MRALVMIALLVVAAPVGAQPALAPGAQQHLDAALALFARAEYDPAAVEFEAAYAIDPAPRLLFALAQARRLGGHCDVALPIYRRYLESLPSEAQTGAARTGITMCEDDLARARAREPAAQPPTLPGTTAVETGSATQPPGPTDVVKPGPAWYRRHPVGVALVAGGVVGVGVGAGFLWSSRSARHAAEHEVNRDDFLDAIDRANSRRRIGIGALIAGGALITAGVLEIVLRGGHASPTVTAGTDGTTVFVTSSF